MGKLLSRVWRHRTARGTVRWRPTVLQLGRLESREVPSVTVVGSEFQVNTYTTASQSSPAVAIDSSGGYVVVWQSYGQDGDSTGIYGQRYNSSGVAQGSEFQVNTATNHDQYQPAVAMDSIGNFVVVWSHTVEVPDPDPENPPILVPDIHAKLYYRSGEERTREFLVNTHTVSFQDYPAVAMDSSGDFVVVWQAGPGTTGDGSGTAVYARRFDSSGTALDSSDFRVNSYTTDSRGHPTVAMDPSGDFVVAYEGPGILAQRYNSSGVAQGSEFVVSTATDGTQRSPSAAMDSDGNFVIVWQSSGQDGSGSGVYGQRFNSSGIAQGSEFQVNSTTGGDQQHPRVAMDSSGNFVVTWQSPDQDGSGLGIYAQAYNSSGVAQGSEFLVNTYTTDDQSAPAIAMNGDGSFVVVWQSYGQDGDDFGIEGQRYTL